VIPDFTSLFLSAGLTDVREDVPSTDRLPEQRVEFTEIGVGALCGALTNFAKAGMAGEGGWSVEEVEGLRKKAAEEMRGGCYLRWDIHVTVGRVPN